MIRMDGIIYFPARNDPVFQAIGNRNVVDPPAFVVSAGAGPVSPPGIFAELRVFEAESIGVAVTEPFRHPFSFFGQKSGHFLIPDWIVNINFVVRNIVIAANDQVRRSFLNSVTQSEKSLKN